MDGTPTGMKLMKLMPPVYADESRLAGVTDTAMAAHGTGVNVAGGLGTVTPRSKERLEGGIASILCFHPERFDDIEDQACALACRIAQDHCLPDGNKRTAILTAIALLEAFGRDVDCGQNDFVDAALAAAAGDRAAVRDKLGLAQS